MEIEAVEAVAGVRPLYVAGVDEGLERVSVIVAGVNGGDAERDAPGDVLAMGFLDQKPARFLAGVRFRLPLAGRPGGSRCRANPFKSWGSESAVRTRPCVGRWCSSGAGAIGTADSSRPGCFR